MQSPLKQVNSPDLQCFSVMNRKMVKWAEQLQPINKQRNEPSNYSKLIVKWDEQLQPINKQWNEPSNYSQLKDSETTDYSQLVDWCGGKAHYTIAHHTVKQWQKQAKIQCNLSENHHSLLKSVHLKPLVTANTTYYSSTQKYIHPHLYINTQTD